VCNASLDSKFVKIKKQNRIWTVSAIHAEGHRLIELHDRILEQFQAGDRIIYHGNYIGYGVSPIETIDEILTFRRLIMSVPGVKPTDLVYLRGGQETMLQKLMQLQFAPQPCDEFLWILSKGLTSTLEAYGVSPHEGVIAAKEGVMSITRWVNKLRHAIRLHPGHDIFYTQLRRAAHTDQNEPYPMLFVHAGLNPERSLDEQGDSFWWTKRDFNTILLPYRPFEKIIRGFDPDHRGVNINCVTATIDGGCGFGGSMVCAGFNKDGQIFEFLEA
jgi:serine/threonine protein phosphatase 1